MKEYFLAQYNGNTFNTYARVLNEAGQHFQVESASIQDILDYHKSISEQAPATVNLKMAVLSSFYNFLMKAGQRSDNPTLPIRRSKIDPVRTVKWLTDEQIHALLDATEQPRDRALVWIALHGLRLAEIVSLDARQYVDGTLWRIEGKGGKTRIVPLAPDARIAVERYLDGRNSGPMFRSSQGRMSRRAVQYTIERISGMAGHRIHPHALRHTYGTRAVRKGIGTIALMQLMGHASAETTQKYVHLDPTHLQEANETVYPATKPTVLKEQHESTDLEIEEIEYSDAVS